MRVRAESFRLMLPVVLIGLVAVLATLQYQWLGQVSEAERAQLQRSLTQRTREFVDEFDGELTKIYQAHQATQTAVASGEWKDFASSIDRWRASAKFPQMVKAVYLAEIEGEAYSLRRYDDNTRIFETAASRQWPAHLESVRKQLALTPARLGSALLGKTQLISISMMPAFPDGPALVIPLMPTGSPIPEAAAQSAGVVGGISAGTSIRSDRPWLQAFSTYVIVDLDDACLKKAVLPALAARHFPDTDSYRIAVLSSDGSFAFSRNVPQGEKLDAKTADVVQSMFAVKLDLARLPSPGTNTMVFRAVVPPGEQAPHIPAEIAGTNSHTSVFVEQRVGPATSVRGGSIQMRSAVPGWRIVVQHPAGSLDAAVSNVRRRNLLLSFGILAVLAAGVMVVVVNARRSEHLAARQMDFVATVSHELRTPLAVIRSAAQNLSAGVVSEPGQAKKYGELIDGEGRRLTDMIEQVLTLAGLESGRRLQATRAVDVRALVDEEVAACKPICDAAGITVEVEGGDEPASSTVIADEMALRRALHNLLANAAKHGADGRWIGVRIAAEKLRDRPEIQIDVSDRGRGIDPADLPHVFEAFHRGRHAIEQQIHGSGLGLSLVKRIIEAHGGRVSVRSTVGQGATFTLHLPASDFSFPEISVS